jgi:hypothetical protein
VIGLIHHVEDCPASETLALVAGGQASRLDYTRGVRRSKILDEGLGCLGFFGTGKNTRQENKIGRIL